MSFKRISRREALQSAVGLGFTLSNVSVFNMILSSLIMREARANTGGEKNLIFWLHYGAPYRWGFDGFLNPNNDPSEVIFNPSVKNFLGANLSSPENYYSRLNLSKTSYQQTSTPVSYSLGGQSRSVYLPRLWDCVLPEVLQAGSTPVLGNFRMRDMLNNICMIRGLDMQADLGHRDGPAFLPRPHTSRPSLTGLVADKSTRRLPAIGVGDAPGTSLGFFGRQSSLLKTTWGEGALSDLLNPFLQETSGSVAAHAANRNNLQSAFNAVLAKLELAALSKHPGAEKFYGNLRNAQSLYHEATGLFANFTQDNAALLSKYRAIGTACRTPVGATGLLPELSVASNEIGSSHLYAVGFAVSEYLISKGLSAALTLSAGSGFSAGVAKTSATTAEQVRGADGEYTLFDEHIMSCRQASSIFGNLMFRTLMASLHEFRKSIGEVEFAKTLVVIGGEYGRNARSVEPWGSDHAPGASAVTLFGGMINGFTPIGNIKKGVTTGEHAGTYGAAAPVLLEGVSSPVQVTNGELSATIADLMEVERPISGHPLLVRENGVWRSRLLEVPKNVA